MRGGGFLDVATPGDISMRLIDMGSVSSIRAMSATDRPRLFRAARISSWVIDGHSHRVHDPDARCAISEKAHRRVGDTLLYLVARPIGAG